MEREYDLFELFPDGTPTWRGHASGLQSVRLKLQEISKTTTNECFALYLPTKEIVARLNIAAARDGNAKPLVFDITYDEQVGAARTKILRRHGYDVISVVGNETAKVILSLPQQCDLFIVGHAAPEEDRKEMVAWLRMKYPGVRILALNSPKVSELPGVDYNVKINGPETLLPLIAGALGMRPESLIFPHA